MSEPTDKTVKITLEDVKKSCNHVGFISAPAQSLYVTDYQMILLCTTPCMRCGHLFTNLNPISTQGPGTLAVPKTKDPGIIKP